MKTEINVNRHIISQNNKKGTNEPAIRVGTYKSKEYGKEFIILDKNGEEVGRIIQADESCGIKPRKCGAKIWCNFLYGVKKMR